MIVQKIRSRRSTEYIEKASIKSYMAKPSTIYTNATANKDRLEAANIYTEMQAIRD